MGTGIGDYAENTVLFEAACSQDAVLRLAGVNRALEGLAIDVFTTMKEFGDVAGDPVLEFCEDWMLADEVTHVKMGSDWLRRLTDDRPGAARGGAGVPAGGRQAVQLRRHPLGLGGVGHRAGPTLPRAGRLHRRGDRPRSPTCRLPRSTRPRPRGARERDEAAAGSRRPAG